VEVFTAALEKYREILASEEEASEEQSRNRSDRVRQRRTVARTDVVRDPPKDAFAEAMTEYINALQDADKLPFELLQQDWSLVTPGIFLRLDVAEFKKPVRRQQKTQFDIDVANVVTTQRVAWVRAFKGVIEDFSTKFVGMESVKDQLGLYISRLMLPIMEFDGYLNFAVMGNPGTGKTELSKRIGQVFYYLGRRVLRVADEIVQRGLVLGYVRK